MPFIIERMMNQQINFGVITVSDRSARGEREDISGRAARDVLAQLGNVVSSVLVPDGIEPVQDAVRECVSKGAQIVITTGGTGITSRDCTPQAISQILSYEIPGLSELVRAQSKVATAALTRSIAGVLEISDRRACVICLPGSPGGVVEGITILQPLFEHIAAQLADSDHSTTIRNHEHAHSDVRHAGESLLSDDASEPEATVQTHESVTRQLAKLSASGTPQANVDSHEPCDGKTPKAVAELVPIVRVQDAEISMDELEAAVRSDRAGAVLSFAGRVRNHDGGRAVEAIEYVAHPGAPDVLTTIAHEIAQTHGICGVAVIHRFGHLQIGEIALGVVISAEHRHEAFEAMDALINRVKMELPVWKRQEFLHGESQWSGMI